MLKQLKYFQSIVKLNNFSLAAEENYISQSAISQQMQALERELGFKLFDRRNRGFTLTAAGEYFYQKSLILTSDYCRICKEAGKIANKSKALLRIGFLKDYPALKLYKALEVFAAKYPNVDVTVKIGNHEELFNYLRTEELDIVFSDQRRAFSDEYINLILSTEMSYIEVSTNSSLAKMKSISTLELKNTPCILIASEIQREIEKKYYSDVIGFQGEFIYAKNLEEAHILVVLNKGFLPVGENQKTINTNTSHIPLVRSDKPISRNYCAFWKRDNSGYYIEEFAEILKSQFENR